ncbi:MAG: hypothetical protein CL840_11595 [Crocinitomicaceae bacterium]|nr:hypothetical protein [Crocinitomicaceae bacterium]|tara:strand:- start:8264 stop:8539 length:276 start_codon:yes stop_codon:yes gene_type:complete
MKYELYVGENCHDCKKVCRTIVEMRLDIPVKNIDKGEIPPIDLFIFPALITTDGDLKAYGMDIVHFLKDQRNKAPRLSIFHRLMNFVREHC